MAVAVRVHHGNGLLQLTETGHVEPHERLSLMGLHRAQSFTANGHARPRLRMAQGRGHLNQARPKDTSDAQQNQRHQYQYSLAARL